MCIYLGMSNITLPASRYLAINIDFKNSILKDVLRIMNISGITKNDPTVLSFDESKFMSVYKYDQREIEVIWQCAYMQIIMARSLFDTYEKYIVVACVSDCGGSNMRLWKEVEISVHRSYFLYPITEERKKDILYAEVVTKFVYWSRILFKKFQTCH